MTFKHALFSLMDSICTLKRIKNIKLSQEIRLALYLKFVVLSASLKINVSLEIIFSFHR
jgi:hypothetical protein